MTVQETCAFKEKAQVLDGGALDKGCFVLSGIDEVGLLQSVDLAVEMVRNGDLGVPVPDNVDENVSDKVVRIVQSYVGVVKKMVWRKGWDLPACSDIAERVLVRTGWRCIAIVDQNAPSLCRQWVEPPPVVGIATGRFPNCDIAVLGVGP